MERIIKERAVAVIVCLAMVAGLFAVPFATENRGNTAKAAASSVYCVYVKAGPLSIRKSATVNSKYLGSVPEKTTLKATSRKKNGNTNWYRITYKKKTGYLCGTFLKTKYEDINYTSSEYKKGKTTEVLKVRSGATADSRQVGTLSKGKNVTIIGYYYAEKPTWYKVSYKGKTRYICADFVTILNGNNNAAPKKPAPKKPAPKKPEAKKPAPSPGYSSSYKRFRAQMISKGFPSSYVPKLWALHKKHPKWKFVAQRTHIDWTYAINRSSRPGINLVEPGQWNLRDKKNNRSYDGRWKQANKTAIKYYMDPRNFLDDKDIYQFMTHKYQSAGQNKNTIKSMTYGCFINNQSHINWIYQAGRTSQVNPNVIAAMIIQEQGRSGNSGSVKESYRAKKTKKDYKGIYNYFNVGAYHDGIRNAIQRGLWYAKGKIFGIQLYSYGRPWNSRYKSIRGGALFYRAEYLNNNQYTYYTKKFNVMNGAWNVGSHEYMTNLEGAASEGRLLKDAYKRSNNYAMSFYIPIFTNMPAKACKYPR